MPPLITVLISDPIHYGSGQNILFGEAVMRRVGYSVVDDEVEQLKCGAAACYAVITATHDDISRKAPVGGTGASATCRRAGPSGQTASLGDITMPF
jgi:hypothetical protein